MTEKFTDSSATRIISALEQRTERKLKNGAQTQMTWGTVGAIDAANKTASAYIYGETDGAYMSEGFRVPGDMYLTVGQKVRVAMNYATGDRWVEEVLYPATTYKKIAVDLSAGVIYFGAGTGAADTNLYRSAANTLKTDDALVVAGVLTAQAAANVAGLLTAQAGLTVSKVGTTSTITFPAQTNDPGFIQHIESSNAAEMRFSISDDRGSTDWFAFGSTPASVWSEALQIRSDGVLVWSGSAAERDTNLYRSSAGLLVTDGSLRVNTSLVIGASGAGQSQDGVNIGGGSIEMRSANPFIDFKIADIDYGARIIYDLGGSDWLEFNGAASYRFDNAVNVSGLLTLSSDINLGARQMSGDAPVVRVYTATGGNTWTKPANFSHIVVEVVGAGGGGGGVAASGAGEQGSGGNGGGGGYARKLFTAANLSGAASFTATVGVGGTLGAAGANAGGTGGTSSFSGTGITTVSGVGGSGGAGGTPSTTTTTAGGGSGGTASGGDINVTGGDGDSGRTLAGALNMPGFGGASLLSTAQRQAFTGNGSTGPAYGGGGTGGTVPASTAARPGGAGASGVVIVTEYYFA